MPLVSVTLQSPQLSITHLLHPSSRPPHPRLSCATIDVCSSSMTCVSSSNLNVLDLNPRRQNHLGLSEIELNDGGVDVFEQEKVSGNGTRRRCESGNESGIGRKQPREREKEHVEELSRITKKPDQQSNTINNRVSGSPGLALR